MPADPKMNEPLIAEHLRSANATPNGLRTLLSMTLMAAHTRKVTDEFFAHLVDDVAEVQIDLAHLQSCSSLRDTLANHPEATPETADLLTDTIDKLGKKIKGQRQGLSEKMYLISQCPTSEDKIS